MECRGSEEGGTKASRVITESNLRRSGFSCRDVALGSSNAIRVVKMSFVLPRVVLEQRRTQRDYCETN